MGSADLLVMLATIGALLWLGASSTRMSWRLRLVAGTAVLALTGWHVFT
jgi:hypothetical protein